MEGDAGTRQLNPTDADETPDESLAVSTEDQTEQATEDQTPEPADETGRRRSAATASRRRLGGRHLRRAAGPGRRRGRRRIPRAAVPSTTVRRSRAPMRRRCRRRRIAWRRRRRRTPTAMIASQSKIIECSTGEFGAQATLYSSVLVDAYQAANVKVQVSDMRARSGAAQRRRVGRRAGGGAGQGDQLRGRRPGAGLPAAGADGARRRQVQDRPAGSGQFVTAVLDAKPETAADDSAPERPTASWLARAGAFSIDVLLGDAVIATMALLTLSAPQRGWLWWVFTGAAVLVVVLIAVNRLLLPTITGWIAGARAVRHRREETRRCRRSDLRDWSGVTWRICSTPPRCSSDGCGRCGTAAAARSPICCCAPRCTKVDPPAARYAPAGRGGAHCGDAAVRGRRRPELSGGVPA